MKTQTKKTAIKKVDRPVETAVTVSRKLEKVLREAGIKFVRIGDDLYTRIR
jgi:hypothetical protein